MKNIFLLPTDNPSRLYSKDGNHKLDNSTMAMDWYISSAGYIPHHLYIISDEEIKEEDWVLNTKTNQIYKVVKFNAGISIDIDGNGGLFSKKIILTTDQELISDGVQAIDDEFLLWFVKNPSCEEIKTIVEYKDGYDNWFEYNKEFWDKHEPGNKPKFGTRYKIIIPKEGPKTFKELFANTGIEPITDESGNIHYNFKATMKEEPKQEIHVIEALKDISNHLDKMNARAEQHAALEEAAKKYSKIFSLDGGHRSYAGQGFIDGAKWQAERIENESEQLINELESLVKDNNLGESYRAGITASIWRIKEWFEQFKKKS